MFALSRAAAIRREPTAAEQVPYTMHVAESLVRTRAGDYVQVFRLAGASFESADDDELNTWHERQNVLWRNVASPNVGLWVHVIRRRESIVPTATTTGGFSGRLARKYRERLAAETLMINELYLSVVYRPVAGAATGAASKLLFGGRRGADKADLAGAIDACEKLGQTVCSALARYEPERLGVYAAGASFRSRLLAFLGVLVNAEWQKCW